MIMKLKATDWKLKLRLLELLTHVIIIAILVIVTTRPVGAQTGVKAAVSPTAGSSMKESTGTGEKVATASNAAEKKNEYQLPYPGLLPDHPLYFLKILRDRIIDFLVADTLKEAEFTLLSADKRLSMAHALVDKGKPELAESTASKGQNYLSRSIALVSKAKSEGKDVNAFTAKLRSSLDKHVDVLAELSGKTKNAVSERFATMASKSGEFRDSLQVR